jgi:hypothetical protein
MFWKNLICWAIAFLATFMMVKGGKSEVMYKYSAVFQIPRLTIPLLGSDVNPVGSHSVFPKCS